MIIVTGASGRIGRSLQYFCRLHGFSDIRLQTRRSLLAAQSDTWFKWAPGEAARKLDWEQASAIIHLAGATPTSGRTIDEAGQRHANVNLVMEVIEIASKYKIPRVLVASSASIYGRPLSEGDRFKERDLPAPINAYGHSKVEMEQAVKDWRSPFYEMPEIAILRIGNIAGADQLLQRALFQENIEPILLDQFTSGHGPLRSYIGPIKLAEILYRLAKFDGKIPSVVNISSPQPQRMENLLGALACYQSIRWSFRSAPPCAIEEVVLATDILETLFGRSDLSSTADDMIREAQSVFLEGSEYAQAHF